MATLLNVMNNKKSSTITTKLTVKYMTSKSMEHLR